MKDVVRHLEARSTLDSFFYGSAVAFADDGTCLFTACANVVKVVPVDCGVPSYSIGDEQEQLRVTAIAFADRTQQVEEQRVFVAYSNGLLREYALPNGATTDASLPKEPRLLCSWKSEHTAPILELVWHAPSGQVLTAAADGACKIFDSAKRKCLSTFRPSSAAVVTAVCWISVTRIIAGYQDGVCRLFDVHEDRPVKEWNAHSSQVTAIVTSPGDAGAGRVWSVSRDSSLCIATVDSSDEETQNRVVPLPASAEHAALAADGQLVVVACDDGILRVYSVEGVRLVAQCRLTRATLTAGLTRVMVARSMDLLVTAADQTIWHGRLCEPAEGSKDWLFETRRRWLGNTGELLGVCRAVDQFHLAVAANDHSVRLYDNRDWKCTLGTGHTDLVLGVDAAGWDPSLIASCSKDNTVALWRATTENEGGLMRLDRKSVGNGHTDRVVSVRLCKTANGGGGRPFIVSVSADCTLKLWSVGKSQDKKSKKSNPTTSDGNNSSTMEVLCTVVAHSREPTCIDVSENDKLLVTASLDKTAKLWRLDSAAAHIAAVGVLDGHTRPVWDARFATSSQKVATSSADSTVRVWSLSDLSCLQTLTGHVGSVIRVSFLNNDTQLVSTDSSGLLKLWTIITGECENTIDAHGDKVWGLFVEQDESGVITCAADGRLRLWQDVSEQKREEQAREKARLVEQEQILANLVTDGRHAEALAYALALGRPLQTLHVVERLETPALTGAVGTLTKNQQQTLLDYVVLWNTNNRSVNMAQRVLNVLLTLLPPEQLLALPNIGSAVQSLLPYTQRHWDRLSNVRQDLAFLNFTWANMRIAD